MEKRNEKIGFVMSKRFIDAMSFFTDEEFAEAIILITDYAIRGFEPKSSSANVNAWCKAIMSLVRRAGDNYNKRVKMDNNNG